jgi:hypothetical protein
MSEEQGGLQFDMGGTSVGLKQVGLVLALAFSIALAIVVGKQMDTEAMAVVVGIVCGVAAGIPTSILLWVMISRREQHRVDDTVRRERQGQGPYPPVVVIQGAGQSGLPSGPPAGYWPSAPPSAHMDRQFQIVGGDDMIVDG